VAQALACDGLFQHPARRNEGELKELVSLGADVVIDYLWGVSAKAVEDPAQSALCMWAAARTFIEDPGLRA
jgi:hypothetical protein